MAVRVVLADDSFLVRRGLASVIESEPEFALVAECADLAGLLIAIDAHGPDVVLTDIRMPPTHTAEGIRAAGHLRECQPGVGVILLTQDLDPDYAFAFFDHGVERRGYLLKESICDSEQLLAAVRTVAAGGSIVDPKVTEALVADRMRRRRSPLNDLTQRERQVLSAMGEGKHNAAIASSLSLSLRSVERIINSIFSKLGLAEEVDIHRRVKAVLILLVEDR